MAVPSWMMRPGTLTSPSNSLIMDDEDPGIMSEAETSSTGFRRGTKPRASLPVVRTQNKSLERPLGLVFLQCRNETKRALLPNEITTMDTVRALFVRSFAHQLTMEYFDSNNVSIYILDPSQNMFYELEDLRDIRDRSILRLYETEQQQGYPASAFPQFDGSDHNGGIIINNPPGLLMSSGMAPRCPTSSSPSPSQQNCWPHQDPDLSYFSEPEFDSDYRNRHVHKASKNNGSLKMNEPSAYYGFASATDPSQQTGPPITPPRAALQGLPGPDLNRSYATPLEQPTLSLPRNHTILLSPGSTRSRGGGGFSYGDPGGGGGGRDGDMFPGSIPAVRSPQPMTGGASQVPPRPPERSFQSNSAYLSPAAYSIPQPQPPPMSPYGRSPIFDNGFGTTPPPSLFRTPGDLVDDETRIRMEQVERQLASLAGLVQTALTAGTSSVIPPPQQQQQQFIRADLIHNESSSVNGSHHHLHHPSSKEARPESMSNGLACQQLLDVSNKTPRLGTKGAKDKCVSFEKSVSFCEDPIDLVEGKHSPQPTESKPAKPAIKSSTLPRTSSSQALSSKGESAGSGTGNVEMHTQLRLLQKRARDLRQEMRSLRRLSQAQSAAVKDAVKDTIQTIKKVFFINSDVITQALSENDSNAASGSIQETLTKIHRQEKSYQGEMKRLEKDLSELEILVEDLRSNVINKKTRVSMADVEHLSVMLSQSSKSVAELKTKYPALEESIKGVLTYQMERLVDEERFLAEEPSKLENTMRRCKKLTSTLVTLRRLASVQEQRQPNHLPENKPMLSKSQSTPTSSTESSSSTVQQQKTALQGEGVIDDQQQQHRSSSLDGGDWRILGDPGLLNSSPRSGEHGGRPSMESQRPPLPPRPRPRSEPNPFDDLLDELKLYNLNNSDGCQSGEEDGGGGIRSPPVPPRDPPPPPQKPIPSRTSNASYAESSVDSIVVLTRKRAPPPPPPPRTAASFRSSSSHSSSGQLAQLIASHLASKSPTPTPINSGVQQKSSSSPKAADQLSLASSHSSSSESVNSQEGLIVSSANNLQPSNSSETGNVEARDLDSRHRELLRKQKELQEQYARLQHFQHQQTGRSRPIAMGVSALQYSNLSGSVTMANSRNYSSSGGTVQSANESQQEMNDMTIAGQDLVAIACSSSVRETDII